jgi:uncharacterized protein YcnI
MKKTVSRLLAIGAAILVATSLSQPALAHVTVKPAQVGVASFQTFTTSVPVEKDVATTGLRIVIPQGLQFVTPTVKPGWTVVVKKEGEGESAVVTELEWTGGTIPAGQRDDFSFSAKTPAQTTILTWKAYQTYQDGSVVSWDQEGSHDGPEEEDENKGPASTSEVIDDLTVASATASDRSTTYSIIAIILSLISLAFSTANGKVK